MSDKSKKLNEALSEIDDKYLDTAERMKAPKKRSPWLKWGAVAAAVLLLAGVAALTQHNASAPFEPYPYPQQGAEPVTPPDIGTSGSALHNEPGLQFLAYEAEYPEMVRYQDDPEAWQEENWNRWQWLREQQVDLDNYLNACLPLLLDSSDNENRVCSPLNVYMALAMAAELSDGESRAQILDLLGASSLEALRENADTLWNLNYRDDGVSTSILAGSLWMRDDFDYNSKALQTLRDSYHASSYYGDMSDPQYTEALRDWLNRQTGGLLTDAAEGVTLDAETMLELLTTVYFRAKWLTQFDAVNTAPETFHAPDGDVACDFMHGGDNIYLYYGERFTALQKPFEAAGELWCLVPEEGLTPEDLLNDPEAMALLTRRAYDYEKFHWYVGELSMPKFDVTSDMELREMLQALGVTDVFAPDAADFSPLFGDAEGVSLSHVRHAARLSVDEEGVTATAFTDMGWGAGGPEGELDYTLDRPFLLRISGGSWNPSPLFVGVVNDPSA